MVGYLRVTEGDILLYRQISNISRTAVSNEFVDH